MLLVHGLGAAHDAEDLPHGPLDLLLEVHGVVHNLQIGMGAPGPEGPVVHLHGVIQTLGAGVVAQVVGELRPLGAGHQVDYRVVFRHGGLGGEPEAADHLLKLLVGDVGLVVQQGPVVDHQHVGLWYGLRRLEGQLLLVELVGHHVVLELQHGQAVAEGLDAEAGDQIRGGLGDGDDPPAVVLLEFLEDAGDQSGLARRRPAGQHDFDDFLFHNNAAFP